MSYGNLIIQSGGSIKNMNILSGIYKMEVHLTSDTYLDGLYNNTSFHYQKDNYLNLQNISAIYSVYNGGYLPFANNNCKILSGGTVEEYQVNKYFSALSIGGCINTLTINSNYSYHTISIGGIVNFINVNSKPNTYIICSSGVVNSVVLGYSNTLSVLAGGTANSTIVSSGGKLIVNSGGTALNVKYNAGGHIYSSTGAVVTYIE